MKLSFLVVFEGRMEMCCSFFNVCDDKYKKKKHNQVFKKEHNNKNVADDDDGDDDERWFTLYLYDTKFHPQ